MRTAADFDQFYSTPDPWRISHASVRDRSLQRWLSKLADGRAVLDLGCGEGHLTEKLFGRAKSVTGIDISRLAIERAKARNLANAKFENADFLEHSFKGYDIISALECLYYLKPEEQGAFFRKASKEHPRKILALSGPIIGQMDQNKYFTHEKLLRIFSAFGFSILSFHDITAYWHPLPSHFVANLIKLPFGYLALDWLPTSMIFQRLYIIRAP